MPTTTDNTSKLISFVAKNYEAGNLDNDSLVQLIELSVKYLNLKTIAQYAKTNKISYNGAKNHRKQIKISGIKFIANNE